MPRGRRKKPFSGKAKKVQLQAKKNRKVGISAVPKTKPKNDGDEDGGDAGSKALNINPQPSTSSYNNLGAARFALRFYSESDEEIRQRKEMAHKTVLIAEEESLEITIQDYFTPDLDIPKRPPWNYEMSRRELERREQVYFYNYLSKLEEIFGNDLNYFEINLETWRQLWRVLEMSDIMLVIVDIRFPALMFPPSLYNYVTDELKKDIILVLNKVDLAPPALVAAWKHYFKEMFPSLHILMFTSFPGYNMRETMEKKSGLRIFKRKGKYKMAAEGAKKLLEVCREIVKDQVDLSSWHNKIVQEMEDEQEFDGPEILEKITVKKRDMGFVKHEKFCDGVLTIGCVGHPNVGKSSLLNAVMGKKVVSVSRTPGHTKHFQTIFLTPQVKLCDCPGLVFPSKIPKPLQILMGSYPIAQLREPYSTVTFLAERLNLVLILGLTHPEDPDDLWSTFDICEAWGKKRGFYTTHTARIDIYRAANYILRMALEGKICLCLYPPGFCKEKESWEIHEDIETVKWIQAKRLGAAREVVEESDTSDEEEGEKKKRFEDTDFSTEESGDDGSSSDEIFDRDESSGSSLSENDSDSAIPQNNRFSVLRE